MKKIHSRRVEEPEAAKMGLQGQSHELFGLGMKIKYVEL